MKNLTRAFAVVLAVGLAAPSFAASDMSDTITEKKSDAKRKARDLKPGDKTAGDHVDDAKDATVGAAAKTRKGARKAGRKVKHEVNEATK